MSSSPSNDRFFIDRNPPRQRGPSRTKGSSYAFCFTFVKDIQYKRTEDRKIMMVGSNTGGNQTSPFNVILEGKVEIKNRNKGGIVNKSLVIGVSP